MNASPVYVRVSLCMASIHTQATLAFARVVEELSRPSMKCSVQHSWLLQPGVNWQLDQETVRLRWD